MIYERNSYYIKPGGAKRGRPSKPEEWISGPDPVMHDMYYAYLKHKSQAQYRKEEYSLTWDCWQQLWPLDKWEQRGRRRNSFCLTRIDTDDAWSVDNAEVITNKEKLKRHSKLHGQKE